MGVMWGVVIVMEVLLMVFLVEVREVEFFMISLDDMYVVYVMVNNISWGFVVLRNGLSKIVIILLW